METRARGGAGRWGWLFRFEFVCVRGVGPMDIVLVPDSVSFVARVGLESPVRGVLMHWGSRHKLAVLTSVSGFGVGDGDRETRD